MSDNINENNLNEEYTENEEIMQNDDIIPEENEEIISSLDKEGSEDITESESDTENEQEEAKEELEEEAYDEIYEEETVDEKISRKVKRAFLLFEKIPPEKRTKTISVMLIALLLILLVFTDIIPVLPNAYNRFYIGNSFVIAETQSAVFDKLNENIIYASSGTIKLFGPNMKCKLSYDAPTGTPMLETNGKNAIVYYENSNEAFFISDNEIKKLGIKEKIKGVSVTSGNYYGIVREEPGYVSCVEVFKKGGTPVYKWHTNSSIIDIAVSENGKYMTASAYEADKGSASATLMFFDMSLDKPVNEAVLKSNIVSEVSFIDSDTVVAFGDLVTQAYSAQGTPAWRIDYKGRVPKSYDIGKNNEIAFIFDRYSSSLSESTVELYNKNGNLRGIYDSKENIKYISCNNGYVLLSLDRQTILLDNDADPVKIKNTQKDFKKAVLFDNYNFAFSFSDGIAEIMSVKH